MKLLIYRRGGLGDTLLTFPIAEIFKKKGFEVHFAGNLDYLNLLKEVGWADKILSEVPGDLSSYGKVLLFSKENFTDCRDAIVVNPFPPKGKHTLGHYLESLGLEGESFSRTLPIPLAEGLEGRVVLHPGSGSPKKNPPLELYLNLYRLLEREGFKPTFVLGVAEENLFEELKGFETFPVRDVLDFAKRLKGAKAFIGNDSGFSHLASYLGVPTIAIFGPTDPNEWKPIGPKTAVIYKKLPCSPCFPLSCQREVEKECLKLVKEKEVLKVLLNLFEI